MSRAQLLLVDADARSLRLLELGLRKAGFAVLTASGGTEALALAAETPPDLVVSDTRLPGSDGYEFCRLFKADPRFRDVPFVFLSSRRGVEDKVRGLELGVDDYLTKPIYVKEIVARVRMLLQKRDRERLERRDPRSGFGGSLADLGIVDLVQTCEMGRKTGTLRCADGKGRQGLIWFRDGRVVDAELGALVGEQAFYRLLLDWNEGSFELSFGSHTREERIQLSAQGLLMEGMRRLDEWSRLLDEAPPLDAVLLVDEARLASVAVPEAAAPLLPLVDGSRSLQMIIDAGARDDLAALEAVIGLLRAGALVAAAPGRAPAAPVAQSWFAPPDRETPVALAPATSPGAPLPRAETSAVFEFPPPAAGSRWEPLRVQGGHGVAAAVAAETSAAGAELAQAPEAKAEQVPVAGAPAPQARPPDERVALAALAPPEPAVRVIDFTSTGEGRRGGGWLLRLAILVALLAVFLLLRRS